MRGIHKKEINSTCPVLWTAYKFLMGSRISTQKSALLVNINILIVAVPTYHTLIVAHTMQPSQSPRNIETASKTVSCSHPFEEGVLQIQIALSKAGGWWEGGNTSSVDLLHTMESHRITQIKAEYKQAHSLYKDTQTATCPSHFLSFLSFICTQAVTHCYSHSRSLPRAR